MNLIKEIPVYRSAWRKFKAFSSVTQDKFSIDVTPRETFAMIQENSRLGNAEGLTLAQRIIHLWGNEGCGVHLGRNFDFPWRDKRDSILITNAPSQARRILAVGFGGGSVESVGFKPKLLADRAEEMGIPKDSLLWLYFLEGIGHMIGLQEADLMRWLVGMPKLALPNIKGFLESFSEYERSRIIVGWGRLMYFSSWLGARGIFKKIEKHKLGNFAYGAMWGAGFAFCMANIDDLYIIKRGTVARPKEAHWGLEGLSGFSRGISESEIFLQDAFPILRRLKSNKEGDGK